MPDPRPSRTAELATVISLGAGVQSTAMLLLAENREIPTPDLAIFADTGWEPQTVYDHLAWLEDTVRRIPIVRVSAGNLHDDAIEAAAGRRSRFASLPLHVRNLDGKKGQLRRQCTKEYKIAPVRRELRRRGYGSVEMWLGITVDEVERAAPANVKWVRNRFPLLDIAWTRADCLGWLQARGYPEPPKSACIGCPYMDNRRWRATREERPDEWAEAVEFDRALRHLPRIDGETFLHPQLVPLDQAVLDPGDVGQLAFSDECEGMCGV